MMLITFVYYNNAFPPQVVTANVTTDAKRRVDITDITTGQEVVFSYTVEWIHTPEIGQAIPPLLDFISYIISILISFAGILAYEDRMKRYADSTFLPTTFEIHWLSVVNSFVLVLLLTAFLAIILMRILKNDFSKYMEIDEDELTEEVTISSQSMFTILKAWQIQTTLLI